MYWVSSGLEKVSGDLQFDGIVPSTGLRGLPPFTFEPLVTLPELSSILL